eukprot:COSAG01_NODE_28541_length_658_cov_4.917710_1_plen_52_part_10
MIPGEKSLGMSLYSVCDVIVTADHHAYKIVGVGYSGSGRCTAVVTRDYGADC